MMEHLHHLFAKVGLAITGITVIAAWLPVLDMVFRIILSIAGTVAAFYSARWYRKQFEERDK